MINRILVELAGKTRDDWKEVKAGIKRIIREYGFKWEVREILPMNPQYPIKFILSISTYRYSKWKEIDQAEFTLQQQ